MWELGRQPVSARRFLLKYQTEDEWFWSADPEWWRSYGMKLPAEVLEKLYHTNAERLLARCR